MRNIHPKFKFTQGSSAELEFALPSGLDLTGYRVWVTFAQNFITILAIYSHCGDVEVQDGKVLVHMSRTDTSFFDVGDVEAQVHYLSPDGADCDHLRSVLGAVLRTQGDGEDILIRGTTPKHAFDIGKERYEISQLDIEYSQGDVVILTKNIDDCTFNGTEAALKLTKDETLQFTAGQMVEIKLTMTSASGYVWIGWVAILCKEE